MAYRPGNQDLSSQIMASHIDRGMSAMAQGILEYSQKQEQKKREEEAFSFLRTITDPAVDDQALKAGIKSIGPQGAYDIAMQLKKEKEQAPLRELEMKLQQANLANMQLQQQDMQRRQAEEQRNLSALQAAAPMLRQETQDEFGARGGYVQKNAAPMRQPSAMAAVSKILEKGGDVRSLGPIGELAEAEMRAQKQVADPRLVELAPGVRVIVDAHGNAQQPRADTPEKDPTPTQLAKLIAERDAFAKAGRMDVVQRYDEAIKNVGSPNGLASLLGLLAPPASSEEAPAEPVNTSDLPRPKTKEERDQLPPGTKYIGPDGKTYTKK